jgi:hypothetical protein
MMKAEVVKRSQIHRCQIKMCAWPAHHFPMLGTARQKEWNQFGWQQHRRSLSLQVTSSLFSRVYSHQFVAGRKNDNEHKQAMQTARCRVVSVVYDELVEGIPMNIVEHLQLFLLHW